MKRCDRCRLASFFAAITGVNDYQVRQANVVLGAGVQHWQSGLVVVPVCAVVLAVRCLTNNGDSPVLRLACVVVVADILRCVCSRGRMGS